MPRLPFWAVRPLASHSTSAAAGVEVPPPRAWARLDGPKARRRFRPGRQVAQPSCVARGPAFARRVPIDVRNLPRGVRVLYNGRNGALVAEAQTERATFLYAEPWAESMG